jgi:mono/diheme cytochrome c family protein
MRGVAPTCLLFSLLACSLFSDKPTPEPRQPLPFAILPTSLQLRNLAEFYPIERSSIERGQVVYTKLCAECHGDAGRGDGPRKGQLGINPTDFTNLEQRNHVPPAWYFRAISKGVVGTSMLSWETQLTEQQRWDATFYTWSLASSSESMARGRTLYEQTCAPCHGVDGLGAGERAGALAHLPTPLADPRYLAGRAGVELHAAVVGSVAALEHDWSAELTNEELQAIINYLWTFLYD